MALPACLASSIEYWDADWNQRTLASSGRRLAQGAGEDASRSGSLLRRKRTRRGGDHQLPDVVRIPRDRPWRRNDVAQLCGDHRDAAGCDATPRRSPRAGTGARHSRGGARQAGGAPPCGPYRYRTWSAPAQLSRTGRSARLRCQRRPDLQLGEQNDAPRECRRSRLFPRLAREDERRSLLLRGGDFAHHGSVGHVRRAGDKRWRGRISRRSECLNRARIFPEAVPVPGSRITGCSLDLPQRQFPVRGALACDQGRIFRAIATRHANPGGDRCGQKVRDADISCRSWRRHSHLQFQSARTLSILCGGWHSAGRGAQGLENAFADGRRVQSAAADAAGRRMHLPVACGSETWGHERRAGRANRHPDLWTRGGQDGRRNRERGQERLPCQH